MDGVGKPDLIVDGYSSPHNFALKPSHAKMLQDADLIFWVGEDLENFLEKPLNSIAKKAEKIELIEIKGLKKLNLEKEMFLKNMTMATKKMITMIMLKKKMTMMITIMKKKRKNTVMTITIMIKKVIKRKKMTMMIMDMKDMLMASMTLTFG